MGKLQNLLRVNLFSWQNTVEFFTHHWGIRSLWTPSDSSQGLGEVLTTTCHTLPHHQGGPVIHQWAQGLMEGMHLEFTSPLIIIIMAMDITTIIIMDITIMGIIMGIIMGYFIIMVITASIARGSKEMESISEAIPAVTESG
ncbi:hypothetical protein MHYP_G00065510 [Metynnis hypsauchen]